MMKETYFQYERKLSHFCHRHGITFLCVALGIVYVWFGVLKVIGISPAEQLVERATHWANLHNIVILIGIWEVVIGLCFFFRKTRRLGILLYFLHYPGIWLPFLTNPEDTFLHIPYGLTLEGQYIVKNLVSLAAVLLIIGSLHRKPPESSS